MTLEIPEERWDRLPSQKRKEIAKELFSADVPWGMYNVVPQSFRDALETIDPRWMGYKEETVTKKADPNDMDENFRLAFWTEFNTSKDMDKPFSMQRVMSGVCSPFYYKHTILKKPRLLAYIAYPPTNYLLFMKNMLYKGQQRMSEIMKVSAVKEITQIVDGKEVTKTEVDMKLANLQIKTFALLDNRVKGAIVQRVKVEQKNLNVNVDATTMLEATPTSVIDIDRELRAVNAELARTEERMKNRRMIESHTSHPVKSDIEIEVTHLGERDKKQ